MRNPLSARYAGLLLPLLVACASGGTETVESPAPTAAPAAMTPTAADAGTVSVTTRSEEARRLFEEGRMLRGNLRNAEARERFDQAIAADPNFALAYAYRASVTPPAERERFLQQAEAHASHASEGERQMIEAYRAFLEGNQARRQQILEGLAQRYPRDVYVLNDLGLMYYQGDDLPRAAETFQRVAAIDPQFAPVHNMLGYSYFRQGDYQRAEQAFQNYIRAAPNEPNPYDSLGELYLKMGRFDEARTQFERAVQLNPRFLVARVNLGSTALLQGNYDAAREAYQRAMAAAETPADRVDIQRRIAESYVHQGNYARAKQELDRAEAMAREANLPGPQAGIRADRFIMQYDLGENEQAERSARSITEITANSNLPPPAKRGWEATEGFFQSLMEARRGNQAAATQRMEAALRQLQESGDPFAARARPMGMGMLALARRDYAETVRQLEQADQSDPRVLYSLGLAHEAMGHPPQAREYFEKVANWNGVAGYRMDFALLRSKAREKLGGGR